MMYLSYGGGVNSTAMLLLLLDKGWKFETVYVDHGGDWPETRRYVSWLSRQTPITILRPSVEGFSTLYEYCCGRRMIPSRRFRWCTRTWKIRPFHKYISRPATKLLGISTDEAKRANPFPEKGIKTRYPLIEYGIDRNECKQIITKHGLPIPMKSGCWFCPFQRKSQWFKLRSEHPELFEKAVVLEQRMIKARAKRGKGPLYLRGKAPLRRSLGLEQLGLFNIGG